MLNCSDCSHQVSEFEHQSHNYDHFRVNTLGEIMNPLMPELWFEWYHYYSKRMA